MPVYYINDKDDATVYYGKLDLKFKNNTNNPLRIYMTMEKDSVLVTLSSILI
jgi:vancomycin resistance protein YoaR